MCVQVPARTLRSRYCGVHWCDGGVGHESTVAKTTAEDDVITVTACDVTRDVLSCVGDHVLWD